VRVSDGPTQQEVTVDASRADSPSNVVVDAAAIDSPPPPPPCAAPSVQSGSACFTLHADLLDWTDAEASCAAVSTGEHLAIVRSATENAAIGTLLGSATIAYLGGSDAGNEGTWLWDDTTPLWNGGPTGSGGGPAAGAFADFNAGEPNNGGSPSTHEEDCLVIRGDKTDLWDDRPCGPETGAGGTGQTPVTYPYVCERAAP
jgi:hypothetical protein